MTEYSPTITDCNSKLHRVGIQEDVFQQHGDLGQIFETVVLGHWESCLVSYPMMLNPTAMPLPPFSILAEPASHERPKTSNAYFVRLTCSYRRPCEPVLVWYNGKSVIKRDFFPGWNERGNWERGPTLPDKAARGSHPFLPAFGYWHERTWHSGAALVICDKTMSLKIRDAKSGRREVPESSMTAKSPKQPWDYLPPDSLMERKINPWEDLYLRLQMSCSSLLLDPGSTALSLTAARLCDLKWWVTRVSCFGFSDWLRPLFPTVVIMGTCTFAELPKIQRAWNDKPMPTKSAAVDSCLNPQLILLV